jgi:NADH-quinone oxidoreductase subunit F
MTSTTQDISAGRFSRLRTDAHKRFHARQAAGLPVIHVGTATCGIAAGALEVIATFKTVLAERNLKARIHEVGCIGHCYAEPLVVIENPPFPSIVYRKVTPGIARMLVKSYLEKGDPLLIHSLGALEKNERIPSVLDLPRFSGQQRLVMEHCGIIDPADIFDYIRSGGYAAWQAALQRPPGDIIAEIEAAGLRGRGGAGYPTFRKWALAQSQDHGRPIVVCNADEGDPGAYMDRTLLESTPHQIIEGVAICARAVGASEAIIYVRAEYPRAVAMVARAIIAAERCGLLGRNVLGTAVDLQVEVFQGSGAFVCGEETALIESIQGGRGTPRHRPPYPAEQGLWNRPTVINNVKTLAVVPWIISHGARRFRAMGTPGTPGTVIFSVVGDVRYPGLIEIPTGVTLKQLIFDICGGMSGKSPFKAVQIGGPSGGCLPEGFLDTPIDYDSLTEAGAMMGSGGMVVMDGHTCMVDVALFFLGFIQAESCGKCTFCRIGTAQLQDMLRRITTGQGREGDLQRLEALCEEIRQGSLCALGRTAPNPVLTTLTYFRAEYEAHIREKRCPACMCRELTAFYIDRRRCSRGCDACRGSCPVDAIFNDKEKIKNIDQALCVKCGECLVVCPEGFGAVKKISPGHLAPALSKA